jgi:HEAT repeat protein
VKGAESHSSGGSRVGNALRRLIVTVVVVATMGWSWLKLWDHYHPAAPVERRLWSSVTAERIAAVGDLGRLGADDPDVAMPALLDSLRDRDARVRAAAATALVSVVQRISGDGQTSKTINEAVSALTRSLGEPEPSVRAAATEALWMVTTVGQVPAGTPVFDRVRTAMIERLGDADASVRLAAIHGIGSLGPMIADGPPPALVAALNDASERNRDAVFLAFGGFRRGLPSVLPSVVRSSEGGDPQLRSGLARLLSEIRPPRFTREALPGLLTALDSRDPEVSCVAAASIAAFDKAAGPMVPEVAKTLDRFVEDASKGSGALKPPAPDLLVALAECLEKVAPHASSQDKAVAALAKLLRPEFESKCRIAAADALGRFRPSPALFTALTERINDQDPAVRVAAMWAIDHADFGMDYQAPKTLAAALEDKLAQVRGAAAAALGHSGVGLDPFVPALLDHAQRDNDPEVRSICVTVLELGTRPPKVTPAIIPDLIKALAVPDAPLREALCTMLFRFGREAASAVPALATVLNDLNTANAPRYRWIAAEALGKIAPNTPHANQAVAALIESLTYQDQRSRTASIRALANFGPAAAAAIPHLEKIRDGKEGEIKQAATETLAKISGNR